MNERTVVTRANPPVRLLDSVYVTEQTFDGMTVRGLVISGSRRSLIFDTLVFPEKIKELLSACSGREIIVVYSHADWDHVWGTCGLPPVEVIAHEECARRFKDPGDVEKTFNEYRAKFENDLASIRLVPPRRTFKDSMSLDLGGITVELRHCPGHTSDSILAVVPERGLLLGADCIETPLPLLNEGPENLLRWISVLADLEADPRIMTCVPSHGTIGGRELLSDNISYLKSLLLPESVPRRGLDAFYSAGHSENRSKAAALRADENIRAG
jgi:glyoxylase-like metal-dependent hydrolase (beta-lactamase superfamily II)